MMEEGEIPVINVLERAWNDDSISSILELSLAEEVTHLNLDDFTNTKCPGSIRGTDILYPNNVHSVYGRCIKYFIILWNCRYRR